MENSGNFQAFVAVHRNTHHVTFKFKLNRGHLRKCHKPFHQTDIKSMQDLWVSKKKRNVHEFITLDKLYFTIILSILMI